MVHSVSQEKRTALAYHLEGCDCEHAGIKVVLQEQRKQWLWERSEKRRAGRRFNCDREQCKNTDRM